MDIWCDAEEGWPIYENFLHVFPRTEELCFRRGTRLWDDDEADLLSDAIKGFQGTSLDIRCRWNSPFNKFLSRLSLEKITSLNISDGTAISGNDDYYNTLPIFPSLQKLRFVSEVQNQQEQARHVKLLMREAPITHFEIEYNTRPKCEIRYYGANRMRSLVYLKVRSEIYEGLRGVRDTLQVYIDQNSLGGGITSFLGLRFTNFKFGEISG
jgi:hypothetical protein